MNKEVDYLDTNDMTDKGKMIVEKLIEIENIVESTDRGEEEKLFQIGETVKRVLDSLKKHTPVLGFINLSLRDFREQNNSIAESMDIKEEVFNKINLKGLDCHAESILGVPFQIIANEDTNEDLKIYSNKPSEAEAYNYEE